mgnify:CR=1 FL=1
MLAKGWASGWQAVFDLQDKVDKFLDSRDLLSSSGTANSSSLVLVTEMDTDYDIGRNC